MKNRTKAFIILPNTKIAIQQGEPIDMGSPYRQLADFMEQEFAYQMELAIYKSNGTLEDEAGVNTIYLKIESSNTKVHKVDESSFEGQSYKLIITSDSIQVIASTYLGQYYGVVTLIEMIKNHGLVLEEIVLEERPFFKNRGIMLDITRGRVPKLSYLKEIINQFAQYKVNQLQLYMEHTFRFSFMSEVNMGKDGITPAELVELDAYCYERHIELIPCIATFGHLYEVLKSESFKHLNEYEDLEDETYSWMNRQIHHTIDCENPESILLIRRMIQEISVCFRSKYLNICGDETFDMGKGRNKSVLEHKSSGEMYVNFLNQILDVVIEEGKTPMYWGDVILQHPTLLGSIRQGAIPLHWWYEATVEEKDFLVFEATKKPYYTCPATAGWNHMMNDYQRAYTNINKMIQYGAIHNATGVLITDWGDFGHINHLSTSLPLLKFGAKKAWNPDTEVKVNPILESYHELLATIGNERLVTFEHVMKWFFGRYHQNFMYGDISQYFNNLSVSIIQESEERLKLLERRVAEIAPFFKGSMSMDLIEVFYAILGMEWMLEFATAIKEERKDLELAAKIEKWFMEYEVIWRKRYKESELSRIREVIITVCRYLRTGL